MKNISRFLTALGLSFVFTLALSQPVWAENSNADLPSEKTLKSELAEAQKLPDGDEKTNNIATIQASLDFLQQIQTQQKNNNDLQDTLIDADSEIQKNSADLQNLKKQLSTPSNTDYASQSLANLQAQVEKLTNQQQDAQSALSAVNTQLAGQSSVSERAQTALTDNVKRTQELNQKLADPTTNSLLKQQIQLELQLIELKNTYNQVLLKNSDQLTVLYQSRYELLNARVQALQKQIAAIQDVINQKNLAQTQSQVEQVQQSQSAVKNPFIQKELDLNAQLSQYLLEQTAKTNTLTQDELRMRNVLDNLTQTQRTIDEQISALQGTLVLSRIIQQQKQKLPTNLNIQGLSKQIADLRVKIFDITQKRNELYDIDAYISKIEQDENKSFTPAEKTQLTNLLTERRKVGSDLIKSLNNQLNLAISLELTQQQITQISDQIQSKLDQQSFWVKSNNPINLDWFKKLPMSLKAQFDGIGKKIGFPTNFDNLPYLLTYVFILFVIGGLIFKFKESIKQRLSVINGEINKLRSDSQWHTPLALFYTALLSLSGTLWFLAACQLLGFFFVKNPQEFWEWSLSMAGYWWFFSFVLAILRPNGILVRHFGFAKESAASLQDVTKRIIVSVVLLLNTSIFSNVMDTGLANDVLGEINTIVALLFCIVIIAPRFVRTEKSLSSSTTDQRDRTLLKIMRVLLQLVPVILIALIALGYYYTALNLITHIINTYIAWVVWSLVRHTIYRGVTVASRRLAYRRLQEKRQQKQQDLNDGSPSDDVVVITEQEEGLALNEVRSQLLRFADLFIWTALFAIFYYVWSDLVTVVSYLRDITLWQQTSTTEAGVVTETISLFNLIVALIIVVITYILVRNIQGILEVLIFSRVKLSQGTPYTITTLLTYIFVAVGGAWAFSTLGMSWSKLQWLFAALSVGLGFGMQEIFANFVSGIILLFERPIRVGDTVTINGVTGTVAKIRIRAITMIDPDRKEVIVPNKSFVTGQVINWALSNTVTRLVISVGVAYGSDLELVKRLLLQAANEQPSVLKDPEPRALFLTFGASTLDHELRVYVGQVSERNDTLDALNRRVNELFAENNIDIAFNQLDIFIKNKDTGEEIPFIDVAKLAQNH
ncbi:MAG: mechanosensitive channel MscK [Haemophilus parainfluenzae]|nr:mechanosensitive channel MscK [Haemophilus parainfluenzae]